MQLCSQIYKEERLCSADIEAVTRTQKSAGLTLPRQFRLVFSCYEKEKVDKIVHAKTRLVSLCDYVNTAAFTSGGPVLCIHFRRLLTRKITWKKDHKDKKKFTELV